MTNYARISNNIAVEVFVPPAGFTVADCFHADVAAQFVVVPDNVTPNSTRNADGTWTIYTPPAAEPPAPVYPVVTPVQFKMLWTSAERVQIKTLRSSDATLDDFYGLVDDPRLTEVDLNLGSTQEGISYTLNALTNPLGYTADQVAARKAAILAGTFQ